MKQRKSLLIVAVLFFLASNINWVLAQQVPGIIPPAPVARQFQKFLGYPVSPATGTADVSIPLYELQAAGLSIPFSLKYHSGGIKVDEPSGNIGYGWSLFPGFRISRTIMGKPDDMFKTDDIRAASSVANDLNYLYGTAVLSSEPTLKDGQFDIFSVHLPSINATFIMQWINGELKATTIPKAPLKITPVFRGASWQNFYFEVTDDKGIIYLFGQNHYDVADGYYVPTEWMLEKVTAPGVGNTIDFTYQNSSVPFINSSTEYMSVDDYKSTNASCSDPGIDPFAAVFGNATSGSSYPGYSYNTWALTSMSFPSGRADFTYSDQTLSKLNSIQFFNTNNTAVKTIDFNRLAGWDLLNTVAISGEGQYGFEYDMQPFTYNKGQDFSGFYNGQNNSTLIPATSLTVVDFLNGTSSQYPVIGGNRQPDEAKMQSHILRKIIYPTGGYARYNYEAHKFISKGVLSFGLGLRVASTEVYDPVSNKTITNTYKYGANESGLGTLGTGYYVNGNLSALDENAFVSDRIMVSYGTQPCNGGGDLFGMRRRTVSSQTRYGNFSFNIPVWYPEVNVYSDGGKTTYKYDYNASYYGNYPIGWAPTQSGMVTSDTKNYILDLLLNVGLSGPHLQAQQAWNGANTLVQETIYNYTGGSTGVQGIIVEPIGNLQQFSTYGALINDYNSSGVNSQIFLSFCPSPFKVCNYVLDKGNENISSITQRDYQSGNYIETTTSYTYDNNYPFNVTSKTNTTSNSGSITENYYYPTSISIPDIATMSSAQQGMVGTLLNNNRLTTLVQKKSFRNTTTPLSSTLFGYKDWSNNILQPEQVYTKNGSNAYESKLRFYNYDEKGNILSVSKENDAKQSYLYGYNKTYPVAQVIGAEYATIAALVNQTVLDNPLSTDAQIRNELNNLRTGLANTNALVTTYTYKPLVGITSQTDPKGKTIYYEYDAFNRLIVIRDKDNNIVKKICYNYAGQPENCTVACTNTAPIWQNTATPLRCQLDTYGQNTGYQEQEQVNVNPCSTVNPPYYNETQWVQVGGQNTSACPLPTYVNLTSTNTYNSAGYTASYYNTTTLHTYPFNVSTASGLQSLGTIPTGNYTLTISKTGFTPNGTFKSGCFKQTITGTSATFYNVGVTTTTCNSITVTIGTD